MTQKYKNRVIYGLDLFNASTGLIDCHKLLFETQGYPSTSDYNKLTNNCFIQSYTALTAHQEFHFDENFDYHQRMCV